MSEPGISRRRVLQGLAAGAGIAAAGSVAGPAGAWARALPGPGPGPNWSRRHSRPPGSRPNPRQPEGTDQLPQIEHIVIYMQENHSYDNYLGMLARGDGLQIDPRTGQPRNTNPDLDGEPVPMFHMPSDCDHTDSASQSWNDSHVSWDGGRMDGFIRAADGGTGSMGYWDRTDLPFYYGLAEKFPICDRWFCSLLGQTFPNRRYLQAATSVGVVSTSVQQVLDAPDAPNGLIWDRLNAHGITWNDYVVDLPDILLFPNFFTANASHVRPYEAFLTDCKLGTLPQVSIVSPGTTQYSEENPNDIQLGEAYSSRLINAVLQSPLWPKTAMFFTYDEHGGYYDHVPPPRAAAPDEIPPMIQVPPDQPGGFDRYGMRVPGFVISPYARRNYVSHRVHDHTSILKFIESKWNLGAMTYRDANADDLFDCFDFTRQAFAEPPTLPAPGLPASGSSCQPSVPPPLGLPSTTTAPSGSAGGGLGAAGIRTGAGIASERDKAMHDLHAAVVARHGPIPTG